jgi:transcriptional antiterminator NusG
VESKWYILHTMSGHENRVAKIIMEQAQKKNLDYAFQEIVIPTENVIEIKKGQKVNAQKKFLPGYILVKMIMNDDSWHLVKAIPKAGGFLGNNGKPSPISAAEAERILKQVQDGEQVVSQIVNFEIGESVKVVDGPFDSFIGVVMEIDHDKNRLKVSVSIFGRATPVDLDFNQVEKCN